MKLFATAFLQVFFVAGNTVFLSEKNVAGVAIFGFMISFLWTANIKKVSCGTMQDRLIYSTGAMLGGLAGMSMSSFITQILTKAIHLNIL